MPHKKTNPNNENKVSVKPVRHRNKSLTGKEKIRKHVSDINDEITDEDILNVNVDHYIEYPSDEENSAEQARREKGGEEEEGTSETKTPWDVID
ncbi:MAG: hypothetical protein C4308_10620 [Chitinophagaceae bacterium]